MPRFATTILVLGLACGLAYGQPFASRLTDANELYFSGDHEGAMSAYRDLQTDEPESDLLYYGLGCSNYELGMAALENESPDVALDEFEKAQEYFDKTLISPDFEIRTNASYNLANCYAQVAKSAKDNEKRKEAFESSINQYEEILRNHPDHKGARNNLDHMRYLLKKMLQNPPPPQDHEGEGEEQEEEEGDEEESEGEEEQEGGDNDQESEEEQEQDSEQQPSSGNPEEEQEPKDRQTIEAILQSIEEQDNREQRDTKNQRSTIRVGKDWW